MKNKEVTEMINNAKEAAETTEETVEVKEDGKGKKTLKVICKYAKKLALPLATAFGGFAIGRLTKGAITELPIPEEAVEAVEAAAEAVSE